VKQKIAPFLWFDDKAEEAANFYVSVFDNAQIVNVSRYTESSPGEPGSVMVVAFTLEGQNFFALNGGPQFPFTPAISLTIDCTTQAEVDRYWERLVEGGRTSQCGWLEDKYGVSWQVVPSMLREMFDDENAKKADAVMQAMLAMTKLDIATLQAAYNRA
jgi:predicted 3-demethylubiquinone-9 3-methyltransferase (glyoxalase superfamily)